MLSSFFSLRGENKPTTTLIHYTEEKTDISTADICDTMHLQPQ